MNVHKIKSLMRIRTSEVGDSVLLPPLMRGDQVAVIETNHNIIMHRPTNPTWVCSLHTVTVTLLL